MGRSRGLGSGLPAILLQELLLSSVCRPSATQRAPQWSRLSPTLRALPTEPLQRVFVD